MLVDGNELPQGKGPGLLVRPEIVSRQWMVRPHIRHLVLTVLGIE